jgi:hypothetical protein
VPGSGYFEGPVLRNVTVQRYEEGHPFGSFWGYKVLGLFQDQAEVDKSPTQSGAEPGLFRYADVSGPDGTPDGKIDDNDRTYIGDPNPDFTYGINLSFSYKNFDFSTFFYGSFGNAVFNNYKGADIFSGGSRNSKTALYDSWSPLHPNANAPIPEYDVNFSNAGPNSYSFENGSYFRNKTMILGFSFPKNWIQQIKIERLRVYIQAANLFTITNYSGLDPELAIDFGSNRYANYPNNQKQWLVGVNIGFN